MASKTFNLTFDGYWREPNIGGLPAQSGIYCVYRCTHNVAENSVTLREVIYIGEAENILDRIAGHEGWPNWTKRLRAGECLCFSAALISPAADRQQGEAAMIFKHKPVCNVEYVNNFPSDTTTIATQGRNALLEKFFTVTTTPAAGRGLLGMGSTARW